MPSPSTNEGASLHDRFTRGESLSDSERVLLNRWYQEQDTVEEALLRAHRPTEQEMAPSDLQATLRRIQETAASIETLHQQNVTLREEIAALQQRLAAKAA